MKKILMLLLVVILIVGLTQLAYATTILYQATDLADTTVGEDSWEYTYWVSDYTFNMDYGFTIYFGYTHCGALDPFPLDPNLDWNVITWDPDLNIPDDGAFDALALVDGASLADPFTVSFVWLGTGTPGAQYFEVYDDLWNTVESGQTAPVPEPATLLLMGTGLVGLAGIRRRMKNL